MVRGEFLDPAKARRKFDDFAERWRASAAEALPGPPVDATVSAATYDPRTSTLTMDLQLENRGRAPLRITRFSTSTATFTSDGSERRLEVAPNEPLAAGETSALRLTMRDAVWRDERLVDTEQPQVAVAGLLFLDGEAVDSTFVEVRSFVVPAFADRTG